MLSRALSEKVVGCAVIPDSLTNDNECFNPSSSGFELTVSTQRLAVSELKASCHVQTKCETTFDAPSAGDLGQN